MYTTQKTMFEATCTECGKTATVPFKPTEGKPVYCRECFSKHAAKPKGGMGGKIGFEPKQAWARRRDHGGTQTENARVGLFYKFSRAPE